MVVTIVVTLKLILQYKKLSRHDIVGCALTQFVGLVRADHCQILL